MLDNWWKILLSFGVLYFLCQMFAEKSLNYGFDIESQYLNYSPFIYAFFVAIVTGCSILFLVHFIRHSAQFMVYGFAAYFSSKYRQKTQSLHFNFKFFVILGLMAPIIALSSIEKYVVRYSILADTYSVSDCGEKIDDIWYIRKNQSQCYAIQFKSLFAPPEYQTIASPSK